MSFLIVSCEKDDASIIEDNENYKPAIQSTGMYNVGIDELGWLVFEDGNHFISTFENLESSNETYMDSFDECLSSIEETMTDEEIDSIHQVCGYTENYEVLQFENSIEDYSSLRADIVEQEDEWLELHESDNDLDFSDYPDHYCYDTYLGALINSYGEYQVGNLVYFTKEDGRAVAVDRSDLNTTNIDDFRELFYDDEFDVFDYDSEAVTNDSLINNFLYGMDENPSKESQAKFGGIEAAAIAAAIIIIYDAVKWVNHQNNTEDCVYDDHENGSFKVGGNEKFHCKSKFQAVLAFGQWSHSWIRHYRKIGGDWKKRSTKMGVYMVSPVLDDDSPCDGWETLYKFPTNGSAHLKDRKTVSASKWRAPFHEIKISQNKRYVYFYDDLDKKLTLRNTW